MASTFLLFDEARLFLWLRQFYRTKYQCPFWASVEASFTFILFLIKLVARIDIFKLKVF